MGETLVDRQPKARAVYLAQEFLPIEKTVRPVSSVFYLLMIFASLQYASDLPADRDFQHVEMRARMQHAVNLSQRPGKAGNVMKRVARETRSPWRITCRNTTPARVPDGLVRASLASYARYWREAFRLPSMDLKALAAELAHGVEGNEHVVAALEAGRGVVMPLPHPISMIRFGVTATATFINLSNPATLWSR